jgi:hypothetical protein
VVIVKGPGSEGRFACWKQVTGDELNFHSDEARTGAGAISAQVHDRMIDLERLITVLAT